MLDKNEVQLLLALLQNEAISLKYASLISGYDPKYPGDLIEGIEQETGIFVHCVEIESIDEDGKLITKRALMLHDHEKAARIIVEKIMHHLDEFNFYEALSCNDSIDLRPSAESSLKGGVQAC